jgi:hypothetical protein
MYKSIENEGVHLISIINASCNISLGMISIIAIPCNSFVAAKPLVLHTNEHFVSLTSGWDLFRETKLLWIRSQCNKILLIPFN